MRGKYIGRDGSMGFRTGQTYEISTELTKIYRDKKKVDVIMVRSGKYNWTENDVIEEFEKYKDKKMIAKIYDITVKEVTEILKRIKD